jgi:hypothetical protein
LHVMRIIPDCGSWVHFGTVCSTWIWMSRPTTYRKDWNPEGRVASETVAKANMMVSRTAILMLLVAARGGYVMLEQPATSFMRYQKRMKEVFEVLRFGQVTTRMGLFGGDTVKPSHLYGNGPWMLDLERRHGMIKNKGRGLVTGTAGGGVTGDKATMKASQTYTEEFGRAAANAYTGWRTRWGSAFTEVNFEALKLDSWSDACLEDIVPHLKHSMDGP